ncbi:MAG: class I SAM-dependent methyltransferase [Candidatus Cloacimonadota bacterium]|nr:MAG: class I SAM-dependent methyltransferase [Candidatus Cloacimonadota bacterium]
MTKPLDMKDIAIIDAFPVYDCRKTVLNLGCGPGRIDFHLVKMGYRIWAIDIKRYSEWKDSENLTFHVADIFDLASMPIREPDIIICSQVLEHLESYGIALVNMMALARVRIIITIPYKHSFGSPGHRHFWDDKKNGEFKDVNEFKRICHPNGVAISKIRTKSKDAKTNKYNYLITVDKRQNLMLKGKRWGT